MPDVAIWDAIHADGEARAEEGREKFGTENWDSAPANLVAQAYEETLDGAWYLKRAAQLLGPGPAGQLRVYISGPYSADNEVQCNENIEQARQAAGAILIRGHYPFCPHTMTANFERVFPDITWREYIVADCAWLPFCHAILMLPGWECSRGAVIELEEARKLGLRVITSVEELEDLNAHEEA